jgi:hypothetical protein
MYNVKPTIYLFPLVDMLVHNNSQDQDRSRSDTNHHRRAQDSLDTISTIRLGLNKKQDDRKGLINNNDWDEDHLV